MMPTAGSIASSFLSRPGADHVRGDADVFGVDQTHVAAAREATSRMPGGVGQQLELVERLRISRPAPHHLP